MIYNFTIQDFSDYIVKALEDLGKEVVLQNPDNESVFPCTVVRTPIETIVAREGNETVIKRFSVSIEEWADKQRDCMSNAEQTAEELKKSNIVKTTNDIAMYDEITQKNRIINTYEAKYNGLNNSFDLI